MRGAVLFAVLVSSSTEGVACQPCVLLGLQGKQVRVLVGPRLVGAKDAPLADARVRVFRVRALKKGEEPRQSLSCFTSYEVGKRVWAGKTDKDGVFNLKKVPAGTYWLAVKGTKAELVHVIEIPNVKEREGISTLQATDGGYVMNKCDIEPISAFF